MVVLHCLVPVKGRRIQEVHGAAESFLVVIQLSIYRQTHTFMQSFFDPLFF